VGGCCGTRSAEGAAAGAGSFTGGRSPGLLPRSRLTIALGSRGAEGVTGAVEAVLGLAGAGGSAGGSTCSIEANISMPISTSISGSGSVAGAASGRGESCGRFRARADSCCAEGRSSGEAMVSGGCGCGGWGGRRSGAAFGACGSASAACTASWFAAIMALKVPVAADHCGFGGGSTNTDDTSVLVGSNSSASSGMASASLIPGGGGGGGGDGDGAASLARARARAEAGGGGVGAGLSSTEGSGALSGGPPSSCRSSVSRASALNTLEQRPQRTYPCATRRSSAVTSRVRAHFGQIVNMDLSRAALRASKASPGESDPALALTERSDIKARRISACHVRDLVLHEPGEHHLPARAHERGEPRGKLRQRSR